MREEILVLGPLLKHISIVVSDRNPDQALYHAHVIIQFMVTRDAVYQAHLMCIPLRFSSSTFALFSSESGMSINPQFSCSILVGNPIVIVKPRVIENRSRLSERTLCMVSIRHVTSCTQNPYRPPSLNSVSSPETSLSKHCLGVARTPHFLVTGRSTSVSRDTDPL